MGKYVFFLQDISLVCACSRWWYLWL